MNNTELFVCPFVTNNECTVYCSNKCALFDTEYERCSFLSIAKVLEETTDPNRATHIKVREV